MRPASAAATGGQYERRNANGEDAQELRPHGEPSWLRSGPIDVQHLSAQTQSLSQTEPAPRQLPSWMLAALPALTNSRSRARNLYRCSAAPGRSSPLAKLRFFRSVGNAISYRAGASSIGIRMNALQTG